MTSDGSEGQTAVVALALGVDRRRKMAGPHAAQSRAGPAGEPHRQYNDAAARVLDTLLCARAAAFVHASMHMDAHAHTNTHSTSQPASVFMQCGREEQHCTCMACAPVAAATGRGG
jgi:hypothetical protein